LGREVAQPTFQRLTDKAGDKKQIFHPRQKLRKKTGHTCIMMEASPSLAKRRYKPNLEARPSAKTRRLMVCGGVGGVVRVVNRRTTGIE
jgi:hypothetical protein